MKREPTHNLDSFKAAMTTDLRWTGVARVGAIELGFGRADVLATITAMTGTMFYKAMPSEQRPGQWQDVYHVPSRAGLLYVKFTDEGVQEFKLLSFKRK